MNKWAVAGFVFGLACLCIAGYVVYLASQKPGMGGVTERPAPMSATQAPATAEKSAASERATPAPVPAPTAPAQNFTPAKISLNRSVAGDVYVPGQPLDVTLVVEREGTTPLMAVGIKEEIPAGWSFDQVLTQDLSKPSIQRAQGNTLEFAWIDVPSFPLTLKYRVNTAPQAQEVTLSGEVLVRTDGPEISSGVVRSLVRPGTEAEIAAATREKAANASDNTPAATPQPTPQPASQAQRTPAARPVPQGLPRTMRVTHAFDTAGYTPGQPFDVKVSLQYNGQEDISALSLQVQLPEGWELGDVASETAPANDGVDEKDMLTLKWPTAPAWPATVTLTLTPPDNASGNAMLRSSSSYLVQQLSQEMESGTIGVAIPQKAS